MRHPALIFLVSLLSTACAAELAHLLAAADTHPAAWAGLAGVACCTLPLAILAFRGGPDDKAGG